jgi:Glu-tRNA(Gln) amidotransferase subunit E-like FAD-binding protein
LKPAPWMRMERYGGWRVPEETSRFLIRRGGADIVDAVVEKTGVDGLIAAIEIGQRAKALARAGVRVERLGAAEWVQVFDLFTGGQIPREAIPVIATRMATDGLNAKAAAAAAGVTVLGRERWASQLDGLDLSGYHVERGDSSAKRLRFLAGRAMRMLKYKAPAKEMVEYLRGTLQEVAR